MPLPLIRENPYPLHLLAFFSHHPSTLTSFWIRWNKMKSPWPPSLGILTSTLETFACLSYEKELNYDLVFAFNCIV